MKPVRDFFVAILISAAIFAALFVVANHAIYKQDLRLCMKEGSKADCEKKLNKMQPAKSGESAVSPWRA